MHQVQRRDQLPDGDKGDERQDAAIERQTRETPKAGRYTSLNPGCRPRCHDLAPLRGSPYSSGNRGTVN